MKFNEQELAAILYLGMNMVIIDGKVCDNEMEVVNVELDRWGVNPTEKAKILSKAKNMDGDDAVNIVSKFDLERKKYVTAYLAIIMMSDGHIDDKELALWQLTTVYCSLPQMSTREAVDFMNQL